MRICDEVFTVLHAEPLGRDRLRISEKVLRSLATELEAIIGRYQAMRGKTAGEVRVARSAVRALKGDLTWVHHRRHCATESDILARLDHALHNGANAIAILRWASR
jgi:hypothetical protein